MTAAAALMTMRAPNRCQRPIPIAASRLRREIRRDAHEHLDAPIFELPRRFGRIVQLAHPDGQPVLQLPNDRLSPPGVFIDDADHEPFCPVLHTVVARHPDDGKNKLEQQRRCDADDRCRLFRQRPQCIFQSDLPPQTDLNKCFKHKFKLYFQNPCVSTGDAVCMQVRTISSLLKQAFHRLCRTFFKQV
jgi:hypothetical protein